MIRAARPLLLCLLLMPLSCDVASAVEGMACLILELDEPVLYCTRMWSGGVGVR